MEHFVQENMKPIRNILGYTQTEWANKLGISRVYLGQLEGNKVKLQRTLAIALMTIVIYLTKTMDRDSIKFSLMSVYSKQFDYIMYRTVNE